MIYFAQPADGGLIKIGCSEAVDSRLRQLEKHYGKPLALLATLPGSRDKRLYRQSHRTFEEYCRDRWGVGKTHANQLIGAAKAVANLDGEVTAMAVILPNNERQVRPLTRLAPEDQREGWQKAIDKAGGRDKRLYRQSHRNFAEYCRDRWGMGRRYAYYLVSAAEVHQNLSRAVGTRVHTLPESEKQLRPLARLAPEDQREGWQKALDKAGGKPPTARQVRDAADEIVARYEPAPVPTNWAAEQAYAAAS